MILIRNQTYMSSLLFHLNLLKTNVSTSTLITINFCFNVFVVLKKLKNFKLKKLISLYFCYLHEVLLLGLSNICFSESKKAFKDENKTKTKEE